MYLSGVTAGCVLATLLNPDGIGNWFTVIHTMRNPLTRAIVSEWQPLLFKIAEEWHKSPKTAINFALVIAPFAALALCFALRPRGGDLALVVIAAMIGCRRVPGRAQHGARGDRNDNSALPSRRSRA